MFALLLALLLLAGCSRAEQTKTTEYLNAMDTIMQLDAYGPAREAGLAAAVSEIERLEALLSVTREDSEVYRINHAQGQPVPVSADTAALLELAAFLWADTDGALDITIYPVLRAWGFTTSSYQVPTEADLASLLLLVDGGQVRLLGEEVQLEPGMEIDLGSLAKGYAGDRAAEALRQAGVTSALLNLGGNVQAVGAKPDGSAWNVGIRDPRSSDGGCFASLSVTDCAVVTSGGYERFFEQDGEIYGHILDPETGHPARSGLQSVTIVGDSGAMCDGLSTALFVMGETRALEYWRSHDGFEAVLLTDDGRVLVTAGLESVYRPLTDGYTVEFVS